MTRPATRRIGISLGGIGSLQDGLGEFARHIGTAVERSAPQWLEDDGIAFDFHLRERLFGLFGDGVGYLPVTRWQRIRHVQPARYDLWHSLHQLNKTRPPVSTAAGGRLVTVHDLNYVYHPSAFSRWRHHRRTQALIGRTDRVIAISRHTADDVKKHLHWAGPLDIILNGTRRLTGLPQAPLPGFEGRNGAPLPPFLFHLSRMAPSKNPQAILSLAAAWPEMTFVMAGPPSDDAKALKAANRLPNVQFHLGISDEQKAWGFAHCTGFLFPSLAEGFGLPPIEAMQFGTPVFLSRLTSLPEIGGDAAEYFDSWDPAAMRAVVERGLERARDPVRREAIRRHAARFDSERAAEEYLALYRRLLGLAPRPAPAAAAVAAAA